MKLENTEMFHKILQNELVGCREPSRDIQAMQKKLPDIKKELKNLDRESLINFITTII